MPNRTEQPFVPPTRKPVSEFPTPDPSVAFYTELVNRDDPAYMANSPVKRGALYSTMVGAKQSVIAIHPRLFFLRERKFQLDDQRVLWDWATDQEADDTYNSTDTYVANAVNYPAFTRTYTVRRDLYESSQTLPIGSPLPGVIAVTIASPGQNYTKARGVIDGTNVAIQFTVSDNGGLLTGIITNTGDELVRNGTAITIIGDGQDGVAYAVSQPVGCVLTQQTKRELDDSDPKQHSMVQVIRVYETLPGPWIYSSKIDKDGAVIKTKSRRQVSDFIVDEDVILNGEWSQTFKEGDDDFVAKETTETRPLPGNPILDTKVDEDGMIITSTKVLVDVTTVVSEETLVNGIWTRKYEQEVDDSSLIKVHQASNKVCWQISEARPVPGNPVVSTKVDDDGFEIDIVRTLKDTTTIVTNETLIGNVWTRTDKEAVSDLVAHEVVTARQVPGAAVPFARVESDHEVATGNRVLRDTTLITPQASESLGFINTTEKKEVTDLVSYEVQTQKKWLDEAFFSISIPNLIPESFRPTVPTFVQSHTVPGIAGAVTLGFGDLEVSEKQLTALLKEVRITSFGTITYPAIQIDFANTEEYGGGELGIVRTLNNVPMVPDNGYLVVSSTVKTIYSDGMGGGLFLKETAQLNGVAWPIIPSRLWDDNMRLEYDETRQVVPKGTPEDPDPGGSVFAWLSEVKSIDTWRSWKINTSKPSPAYIDPATALVTEVEQPFRFPGLLYRAPAGYFVRAADAKLVQHINRTWWEKSVTKPVFSFTPIIMDDPIISELNDITKLAYAGPVLHDDLLSFNTFFYPATIPSFTEYTGQITGSGTLAFTAGSPNVTGTLTAFLTELQVGDVFGVYNAGAPFKILTINSDTSLTLDTNFPFTIGGFLDVWNRPSIAWVGNEKVIGASVTPEKEPNIWKIQTQSVVMR